MSREKLNLLKEAEDYIEMDELIETISYYLKPVHMGQVKDVGYLLDQLRLTEKEHLKKLSEVCTVFMESLVHHLEHLKSLLALENEILDDERKMM